MKTKRLILALILAAPAMSLAATDGNRFLLGTSLGQSDIDDSADFIAVDETDTAFRLYGGYALSDRWVAEIGYLDMGAWTTPIATIEGPGRARVELDGVAIGLKPQFELGGQWFAQGQLGLFLWDAKARVTSDFGSFRESDDGHDPYYGVGIGRYLGSSWQLSGDWTRYETDESDVDFLGVSLTYRMGG